VRKDARGVSLIEVMTAVVVVVVAFLPLFAMLSSSRGELADAQGVLALLERLDGRQVEEPAAEPEDGSTWPLRVSRAAAEHAGRRLALERANVDPDACWAPRLDALTGGEDARTGPEEEP
jgi:hypothetical protein